MKFMLIMYMNPQAWNALTNPMAALNHAVAVAMADGPAAGLSMLSELEADPRLAQHHRLAAVRAHLLELAGDDATARENYLIAACRTSSLPEQRYLRARADRLAGGHGTGDGAAAGPPR
jgi:predicted RNA polymerase sigma factor